MTNRTGVKTGIALLQLARPDLSFAAGLCVVIGQLLAAGKLLPLHLIASGFFSVASISAAILVMNDYLDVEADKVNAPDRPIPSGRVSKHAAGIFAAVLFCAGLALSAFISGTALSVALLLVIVGILYNRNFKKSGLFGNLLVSFSVGMTFIFGGISAGSPFEKTVLFFAVLTALIDLGEEIAADVMDMEGDKRSHSRSLAIRFGKTRAVNVSTAVFSSIVLLTGIPFLFGWFGWWYTLPLILLDSIIIVSVYKFRAGNGADGRVQIKRIYRGGTLAMCIFLVMKLAGV